MSNPLHTILIVDGDSDFLDWAKRHLHAPDIAIETTDNAQHALDLYEKHRPSLTIAEVQLRPFSGMELLRRLRKLDAKADVLLTTGFPPTAVIVEAMQYGAYDFLGKESLPFHLKKVVDRALQLREELKTAATEISRLNVEQYRESIIGKSEAIQNVVKMIGRIAHTDAPVMITGESGSGKELVARAIAKYSRRSNRDYVAINCAAIPENLLESELFGHERGSFTGASSQRIGRFEQCNGGTLFLDEIGDMPLSIQGKILRVLQEGEFSRVGSNEKLRTDVRIIAATNRKLEDEVVEKKFREDLFYRLNVVRIEIAPLRRRKEDIPLLADYFLQNIALQHKMPRLQLSQDALRTLEGYHWPGNVRELENTLQRACLLATADVLLPRDIPLGSVALSESNEIGEQIEDSQAPDSATEAEEPTSALHRAVETLLEAAEKNEELELLPWLEKEMTAHAMKRTQGNQVKAAKLLGITRSTLRKRLERYPEIREQSRS